MKGLFICVFTLIVNEIFQTDVFENMSFLFLLFVSVTVVG